MRLIEVPRLPHWEEFIETIFLIDNINRKGKGCIVSVGAYSKNQASLLDSNYVK